MSIDQEEVKETLEQIDGILDVHDLHIWTITSGLDTLTCHILIDDSKDSQDILQQVIDRIRDKYNIEHATVQIEKSTIHHHTLKV